MKYAIIEDGQIMGFREIPDEDEKILAHYRKTETLVRADREINNDAYYYSAGKFIQKPRQPTPFHTWSVQLKEWVKNPSAEWEAIRDKRDLLLAGTDWMVLLDSPVTPGGREAIQIYRQALRDITAQSDPLNIIWPTRPEVL